MLWFILVTVGFGLIDLIPLFREKRRREAIIYLTLGGLALAAGICYFCILHPL